MRYEKDTDEAGAGTKLTYLLIGGGIGAILGLLFAPKAGEELRGDIADATRKGLEKGKETAALVGEKAGDYYEVSRDKAADLYGTAQEKASDLYQSAQSKAGDLAGKASDLYQSAQDKAGDLAGKAGDLSDKAKDAVSGSNPLSAAIEAGKKAYSDEKQRTDDRTLPPNRPVHPVENKSLNAPKDTADKKDENDAKKQG